MPTRYTLRGSGKKVYEDLHNAYLPNEIAPTQFVPAICQGGEVKLLRWGFTPNWAKEDFGGTMCHARRERAFVQNAFKTAIWRRRCLIPATAFFEWRDEADSIGVDKFDPEFRGATERVKYRFSIPSQPLFYFAGIWEDWIDPNGSDIESCAILTTYPNSLIIRYKPAMPCILKPGTEDKWMDFEIKEQAELDNLLRGIDSDLFHVARA